MPAKGRIACTSIFPATSRRRRAVVTLAGLVLALLAAPWLLQSGTGLTRASATDGTVVIAVAGDIACPAYRATSTTSCQQAATGSLLPAIAPSAVLPLGDTQYDNATSTEYAGSYNLVQWGG